ncbi:MAG TPA: formyltransferase [Synergistales bacterium]|nr:formyltransferase [Synergistales bacterium]
MKAEPRVLLAAYSEVGVVCLEELLAQKAQVVGVFTHADDQFEEIWFRSVARTAAEAGIPVFMPENINAAEEIERIRGLRPDILFSFYYRKLISKEILDIPQLGAYNMHGSLLPRYRGRACVNWAVLKGETQTGATLHVMTEKADAGDILDQEAVPIEFTDTAQDVFWKVRDAARKVLARTWPLLREGRAPRTPQDESLATTFGRRRPSDGLIDWNRSALELYNLVRAVTHPFPGAFSFIGERKWFIWKAWPLESGGKGQEGKVLGLDPLVIGTREGSLRIDRCQAEGEPETDGADFASRSLRPGQILGGKTN